MDNRRKPWPALPVITLGKELIIKYRNHNLVLKVKISTETAKFAVYTKS